MRKSDKFSKISKSNSRKSPIYRYPNPSWSNRFSVSRKITRNSTRLSSTCSNKSRMKSTCLKINSTKPASSSLTTWNRRIKPKLTFYRNRTKTCRTPTTTRTNNTRMSCNTPKGKTTLHNERRSMQPLINWGPLHSIPKSKTENKYQLN